MSENKNPINIEFLNFEIVLIFGNKFFLSKKYSLV